jgi:hypothetical protein
MSLKLQKDNITPSINKIQRELSTVARETHKFWVSTTPKDKGNARSKTVLKGNVIEANYPYAKVLDQGYSKQAPQGMSKPTEQFFKRLLNRLIRK